MCSSDEFVTLVMKCQYSNYLISVMRAGNALHQVRSWVISKVRADVADPEALAAGQRMCELVGRLVQHADLLQAELGVTIGDGLAELMAQRVEHGVMRVNAGQPVFVQLVGHDADQRLLSGCIVCPVAHNLRYETSCYKSFLMEHVKHENGSSQFFLEDKRVTFHLLSKLKVSSVEVKYLI